MSKFQIEKVEHSFICEDISVIVCLHYPSGKLFNVGYISETLSRFKTPFQTGIWRIKSLKNKNN